jgi:hypothetical protein
MTGGDDRRGMKRQLLELRSIKTIIMDLPRQRPVADAATACHEIHAASMRQQLLGQKLLLLLS